jgi:hypothetical protein
MTYVPHPWDRYSRRSRGSRFEVICRAINEATGWRAIPAFLVVYVVIGGAMLVTAGVMGSVLWLAARFVGL